MSPNERLWPGYSTAFEKQARDAQKRGGYRKWIDRYENGKDSSPVPQETLMANLHTYYRAGDGTLVKGSELADGILPINLQETTPSLVQRIKKELGLLICKRRTSKKILAK